MKVWLFLIFLLFYGCASNSGYNLFYKSYPSPFGDSDGKITYVPLKEGETPSIHSTEDPYRDFVYWLDKGYIFIGEASFNGALEDKKEVIKKAKKVGATDVLWSVKYTNTTSSLSGSADGGFYVDNTRRYDQVAVFLVKLNPEALFKVHNLFPLGVIFTDIPPETRKNYGLNVGAVVGRIYEGSPAFNANLLMDDVVIEVNGDKVIDGSDAHKKVLRATHNTRFVPLTVIRNGVEKSIVVDMNSEGTVWHSWGKESRSDAELPLVRYSFGAEEAEALEKNKLDGTK